MLVERNQKVEADLDRQLENMKKHKDHLEKAIAEKRKNKDKNSPSKPSSTKRNEVAPKINTHIEDLRQKIDKIQILITKDEKQYIKK